MFLKPATVILKFAFSLLFVFALTACENPQYFHAQYDQINCKNCLTFFKKFNINTKNLNLSNIQNAQILYHKKTQQYAILLTSSKDAFKTLKPYKLQPQNLTFLKHSLQDTKALFLRFNQIQKSFKTKAHFVAQLNEGHFLIWKK